MRRVRNLIGAMVLAIASPLGATQDAPLGWLTGEWRTAPLDLPDWTEEAWTPMRDGVMQGDSRSGKEGRTTGTETMRITMDGATAIFTASPNGAPPVSFREVSRGAQEIVFENAAHDYPQRVRYWRDGDGLKAEISRQDGSRPMRWSFVRVR